MFLQPRGSRVLLRRKLIGKRGNLFIPANSREMKHNVGEVVVCGPDCPDDLKAGDTVTFGQYAPLNMDKTELMDLGLEIPQDYEYLLVNEEDILCHVLRDDAEAEVVNA